MVLINISLGHRRLKRLDFHSRFDHPRFGRIKCIRTIKSVEADEELTVEYGYDHNGLGENNPEAPQWYKSQLKQLSL